FGSFKKEKVLKRILSKGEQGKPNTWRIVFRLLRKVGTTEVWGRANCGKQVAHQGEMKHLLGGNVRNDPLPALDGLELLCRDAFADVTLQTEGRIQILAHDHMLKRRCFRENED